MKKEKKFDIAILLSMGALLIIGILLLGNFFGSNVDWINQHIVFPEYFRNLFYDTGNLFPQISWNLGLGQNIYNFSYYGYLNPIVLISYFFPFLNMTFYIMLSSSVLYLASIYIFYKWIEPKYDRKMSFFLTTIFMFSGPLLFHFHRQLMFVNYIPFLLLSLITIDCNKKYQGIFLSIWIFMMIMCSYYYSVGGLLVIFIYYIYRHYQDRWKEKVKIFVPMMIGVLLSGILLIPTIYTILSGRNSVGDSVSFWELLLPTFDFGELLYGAYTLGLTAILIPSLINSLYQKDKSKRFLGICLIIVIVFPIFRYVLNGGLYIRSKVLIPFLPLFVMMIGNFIQDVFHTDLNYKKIIKSIILIVVVGLFTGYFHLPYYLDLLFTILFVYFCYKKQKKTILLVCLSLLYFVLLIGYHMTEDFVSLKQYQELHQYDNLIYNQVEKDSGVYRFANTIDATNNVNMVYHPRYYRDTIYSSTYNAEYYSFYHNILNSNNDTYNHLMLTDTNNIVSHRLFGMKYILSNDELNEGYQLLSKGNDWYLYKNRLALSIGYASSNIYSFKEFNNLSYPNTLDMLLTGIVVDKYEQFSSYDSNVIQLENNYKYEFGDYISSSVMEDYTLLQVTKDSTIKLEFLEPIKDKILFIEIEGLEANSCAYEDISINIGGINNSLSCDTWRYSNKNNTFHYVINDNEITELDAKITEGTYKITDISFYTIDRNIFEYPFDQMNDIKIEDNILTGAIDVAQDGYMSLSIPYDSGFEICVDDNVVDYEKVNAGFIGFPIKKGIHNIKITYISPFYKLGTISTLVGIFVLLLYGFIITIKGKKNTK